MSNALPLSIPKGTKDDKVWSVMHADEGETVHETFNKRFDAMFGEDCLDSMGRLQHIRTGKQGLGLVCSYLSKINWADGFPLDIVEIKLQRLVKELKIIRYVDVFFSILSNLTDKSLVKPKVRSDHLAVLPPLPS